MLKVLFLQAMYNLSDEKIDDAMEDRISFRRFAGFSLGDDTPDNATVCRFRAVLLALNIDVLDLVNQQLDKHRMRLRTGTLVDATIIQANAKTPIGGEVSMRDLDASVTQKGGKYYFGFKAHVGMDKESSLINIVKVTSADIHDSLATYECLEVEDQAGYLDKAYDNDVIRVNLRHHKIKPRIQRRIYARDSELRKKRISILNKAYGKIRCGVEKYFGTIKRSYGVRQARYLGIAKNQLHMEMVAISYNLKRMVKLLETDKKMNLRPA
jgi:IS5 family transposase